MNYKFMLYTMSIFFLLFISINNIMQYTYKRSNYNGILEKYELIKNTYNETLEESNQLDIGSNKERYFREQYNVSKNGEILFKFPEDDNENISS